MAAGFAHQIKIFLTSPSVVNVGVFLFCEVPALMHRLTEIGFVEVCSEQVDIE